MLLIKGSQIKAYYIILLIRGLNWIIQKNKEKRWRINSKIEIESIKTRQRVDLRGE